MQRGRTIRIYMCQSLITSSSRGDNGVIVLCNELLGSPKAPPVHITWRRPMDSSVGKEQNRWSQSSTCDRAYGYGSWWELSQNYSFIQEQRIVRWMMELFSRFTNQGQFVVKTCVTSFIRATDLMVVQNFWFLIGVDTGFVCFAK